MKIEEFKSADYPEVSALWDAAGLTPVKSDEPAELSKLTKYGGSCFMVGRDPHTNKVIATCMGGFDGRRGYIYHLAVQPKLQHKGLGALMLEKVMDRLYQAGAVKVHLLVQTRNAGAVEFYKKCGWIQRTDLVVMSKNAPLSSSGDPC